MQHIKGNGSVGGMTPPSFRVSIVAQVTGCMPGDPIAQLGIAQPLRFPFAVSAVQNPR